MYQAHYEFQGSSKEALQSATIAGVAVILPLLRGVKMVSNPPVSLR